MKHQKLLDELAETYNLIVNSEFHVQIKTVDGKHDIWFPQKGGIKFKAFGQQGTLVVSESQLKTELAKYRYDDTDLAIMQRLSLIVKKAAGKSGIFVDAGFRDGHARVAILRTTGGDYDIAVRQIEIETNVLAEDWAIKAAIGMYPGEEPVFSDCKPAVEMNPSRARWIPREENKEADHFGNMRNPKRRQRRAPPAEARNY